MSDIDNESIADLPEGWEISEIIYLFEFKYGKGLVENIRNEGNYKVYGSNGIVGSHNESITNQPCIIVGRKGSIGEVHFNKEKCWPIDTTYYIDDFKQNIPKYVYYYLKNMNLKENDTSSAIPGLSRSIIYKKTFLLPPLNEQKRIVAKIDEVLSQVNEVKEKLQHSRKLVESFKKSVLTKAFKGELVPTEAELARREGRDYETALQLLAKISQDGAKTKNKTNIPPTDSEPPTDLPEGWRECVLENIACVLGGKRLPKSTTYSDKETDYRYIRVTDFENMSVNVGQVKYITDNVYSRIKQYVISKNDLYISIAGSIGKVGIIPDVLDQANLTENAAKIVISKDIDQKYLCYLLNSQKTQDEIQQLIKASGQPKLALFRIELVSIILAPLEEQKRIVAKIEELYRFADEINEQIDKALAKVDNITQAVLRKAFKGELVPTEAELARHEGRDYEPASVLLEKIKNQTREVSEKTKIQKRTNMKGE